MPMLVLLLLALNAMVAAAALPVPPPQAHIEAHVAGRGVEPRLAPKGRIQHSSRRHSSSRDAATAGVLGISAHTFGAFGCNDTTGGPLSCPDDAPALQRAINVAMAQRRTLLLPAGNYYIGQPLRVPCDSAAKGCGGSFHMRGEGMQQTYITPRNNISTILIIEPGSPTTDRENPWNMTRDGLVVSDLSLDAGGLADYGIHAAALTRSFFRNIQAKFLNKAGLFLGFGWCNRVEDSNLSENYGFGIVLKFAANNIDLLANNIEGNHQGGIMADNGAQLLIQGNCIEGTKRGPAIICSNFLDVSIKDNYYESNYENGGAMVPMQAAAGAANYSMLLCADILLIGSHALPAADAPDWSNGPSQHVIEAGNRNTNVIISGNFHRGAACHSYAGVVASSVENLEVTSNQVIGCGGARYPGQLCAMVATGIENAHWHARDVRVRGNGGWARQMWPLQPNITNSVAAGLPYASGFESFHDTGVTQRAVFSLARDCKNTANKDTCIGQPVFGLPTATAHTGGTTILGESLFQWPSDGGGSVSSRVVGALVHQIPLTIATQDSAVLGNGVWFAARAQFGGNSSSSFAANTTVSSPRHQTLNLTMLIDPGNGRWHAASWLSNPAGAEQTLDTSGKSQIFSMASALDFSSAATGQAVARFAIVMSASSGVPPAALFSAIAVAPIGVSLTNL